MCVFICLVILMIVIFSAPKTALQVKTLGSDPGFSKEVPVQFWAGSSPGSHATQGLRLQQSGKQIQALCRLDSGAKS